MSNAFKKLVHETTANNIAQNAATATDLNTGSVLSVAKGGTGATDNTSWLNSLAGNSHLVMATNKAIKCYKSGNFVGFKRAELSEGVDGKLEAIQDGILADVTNNFKITSDSASYTELILENSNSSGGGKPQQIAFNSYLGTGFKIGHDVVNSAFSINFGAPADITSSPIFKLTASGTLTLTEGLNIGGDITLGEKISFGSGTSIDCSTDGLLIVESTDNIQFKLDTASGHDSFIRHEESSTTWWSTGVRNTTGTYTWSQGVGLTASPMMTLDITGELEVESRVICSDLKIVGPSVDGHPKINFTEGSTVRWTIGNDGDASDEFVIGTNSLGNINSDKKVRLSTTGDLVIAGKFDIGSIDEIGSDSDKFLMSSSGQVKYVTGANLLTYIGGQASGNYITGTGSLSAQDLTDIGNLSGTNTGDQVLPTDFVSAASGGTFGGSITATNLSGTNTGDGTYGIADTNYVKIDSASVADDEYARFTANGLESRSTGQVRADIGAGTSNVSDLEDLGNVSYSAGQLGILGLTTIEFHEGTQLIEADTPSFKIDCAGDITLSTDGGNVLIDDGTNNIFDFDADNAAFYIHNTAQTAYGKLYLNADDFIISTEGDTTRNLVFKYDAGGLLEFWDDTALRFRHDGPSTKFNHDANNYFEINVGADGATTLSTLDGGVGIDGNLTLNPDGELIVETASGKTVHSKSAVGFTKISEAIGASSTTIDFRDGNKAELRMAGFDNTALELKFPPYSGNFTLVVEQYLTGSLTLSSWKALDSTGNDANNDGGTAGAIRWAGGSAPTLSTAAGSFDIVSFYWDAEREMAFGVPSLNFS